MEKQGKQQDAEREQLANRPFRADWLSFLLLDLAGIKCYFSYDNKSWIEPDYHWDEPGVITSLKTKPSPAQ